MYVKLFPHSPAPTPDRVDARNCGIRFEKVTDQEYIFSSTSLGVSILLIAVSFVLEQQQKIGQTSNLIYEESGKSRKCSGLVGFYPPDLK